MLFFLVIRRPPSSTPFPTRRSSDLEGRAWSRPIAYRWLRYEDPLSVGRLRSEEHTSELQSRPHLVCRLLLEKKKTLCEPQYKGTRNFLNLVYPLLNTRTGTWIVA